MRGTSLTTMTAGCQTFELLDEPASRPVRGLVLYPSASPKRDVTLGPYTLSVAMEAPVAAGCWPLVAVSHGSGGSHLVYRNLAAHLARHGFVVVMAEHPGDNRNDRSLAGTVVNLEGRPRHLRQLADWAFANRTLGPALWSGGIAIVGHSMGGYTALAAAGGQPAAFPHEAVGACRRGP